MKRERADADIYILGAGVCTPHDLTLETIKALRLCKVIYSIYPFDEKDRLALGIEGEIRSLWYMYESSVVRRDTYELVAETILDTARRDRPVAFLAPGSPVVFDSVAEKLFKAGQNGDLRIRLVPAVSSIDTIMADLGQDVAPGLQIYDASWFVASKIEPCVYAPCLLLQVTAFGTWFSTINHRLRSGGLKPLRDHLLRFYPDQYVLMFVRSATTQTSAIIHEIRVTDLANAEAVPSGSLFIPAFKTPVANREFVRGMKNKQVFESAYRPLRTGE